MTDAHIFSSLFYSGISMRKFSEQRLSPDTKYESKSADKSSDVSDVQIVQLEFRNP